MTVMEQQQKELREALGDFAQRRGTIFFEQITANAGAGLRVQGQFIAIDALSGEYVLGTSIGDAMDVFERRFGTKAVAWLIDLDA